IESASSALAGVAPAPVGFLGGFFFQAEDGIRARNVTGVQTCALPISGTSTYEMLPFINKKNLTIVTNSVTLISSLVRDGHLVYQIGRASCRERVSISVDSGS